MKNLVLCAVVVAVLSALGFESPRKALRRQLTPRPRPTRWVEPRPVRVRRTVPSRVRSRFERVHRFPAPATQGGVASPRAR